MKVFVAGATGVLGRAVVTQLLAKGHTIFGLSRRTAMPFPVHPNYQQVVGDALDAELIGDRMRTIRPDAVAHLLTALPPGGATRPSQLRATNVLRIRATAILIDAAVAAGARRLVAESFVGVHGSALGTRPIDEDTPLAPIPSGPLKETVGALRSLEEQLMDARLSGRIETVALRIGFVYGADVPSSRLLIEQARSGKLFLPGHPSGVGAFVHQHDAASLIVAAIEHRSPAPVYHVVDDHPLPVGEFVDALVHALGLPRRRTLPLWVVKLAAPVAAELMSARFVLSNARAKRDLAWALRYPTIWTGMAELLPGKVAA